MAQLSLSIAATFTAEPIAEALRFWLSKLRIDARLEFAGYSQVFQELANPHSISGTAAPGVSVFLVRIEDWVRDQKPELRGATLPGVTRQFIELFGEFAARSKRPAILFICPDSSTAAADLELSAVLHSLHAELRERLVGYRDVTVIFAEELESAYPVAVRDDVAGDRESHLAFTPAYFTALATLLARRIRAITQPAYKVIVVDGDNTLWDGVAGEVGPGGVQFSPERIALHHFLLSRKRQGLLLALASKNEEPDVAEVFRRSDCILRREDFVAWKVNWDPKSRNIARLAKELELGLDSFLFLDDNPIECAEVSAHCPGVNSLLLPADSGRIPEFLRHLWAFDAGRVTAVDEKRTELYRQQGERNQFREQAQTFAQFLQGLDLQVALDALEPQHYERAAQLSQRTNQFNASGVRWQASQLGALLDTGERRALLVRVQDRFGDYGEVGLAVFYLTGNALVVENLLLSCRVLGKGVEARLLARLGEEALRSSASQVKICFRPTDRNQPAERFLRSLKTPQSADGFEIPAELAAKTVFDPASLASGEESTEASETPVASQRGPAVDFVAISELANVGAIQEAVAGYLRRARPESAGPLVAPRNKTEATLAKIWQDVLHLDRVGVTDAFLNLGGQSLQAASVASRIARELGVRVPLGRLLAAPTIEDICALIADCPPADELLPFPRAAQVTLSQAQHRLWFLDQFIPNPAAYNIPVARHLRGPLDFSALEAALARVIERHPTLRSTVQADGTLRFLEMTGVPVRRVEAGSESEALAQANAEAARVFDLKSGPLLRCTVYSWGPSEHLLVLNVHHIVSDGWSMGILLRELAEAYQAQRSGGLPAWRPLPASYADFANWQEGQRSTPAAQAELAYWTGELSGAPPLLDLPCDKPRPSVQTYTGAAVFGTIPPADRAAIEGLAERAGCTSFTVLLATWQASLHRYSRQDDIVVGTPVAGRPMDALDGVVGCFVNTLAIRTPIDGSSSFLDHLQVARSKVLGALTHQNLAFEELVNELNLKRDLSRSPLFQVMFVLQNSPVGDFAVDGVRTNPVHLHNGGAKFDLLLEATPQADGYSLMLEFNTSLFSADTANRILGHFTQFLQHACADPQTSLDSLTLMDREETGRVLSLACGEMGSVAYETTLQALFEAQVERTPDAVAVVFGDQSLTYGELNQRANQLAASLRRMGVGPNVLVGLFLERSLEMVIGLYGILKAGGAYVPIDPEYPADRVQFMVEDSAPAVLLIQGRLAGQLPSYSGKILRLDDEWDAIGPEETGNPAPASGPGDPAYMIYTSGSTGRPKGALNSHRGICNRLLWMQDAYQLRQADSVLQKTPFSFDVSVWEFFWPLQVGARMVVAKPGGHRDPEYLVQLIREESVTVLHFVPSMLVAFLADPGVGACKTLRHVICSGEALPHSLQEQFFGILPAELHNLYGPTEAAVDVTHWTCVRNSERTMVPIGRPVANTQIYILDGHGALVPVGVPGELYIAGVQVGLGYHNRPELTAEKFVPDTLSNAPGQKLYRTGDLARYLPGGEVEYLGRMDHQVKIRGFRIELGEIESALLEFPEVQEAVVVAREDQPGTKRLVAYVASSQVVDVNKAKQHLKQSLPEYMVPTAFVVLEKLPLSPNGKIDRKALPAPALGSEQRVEFAGPRNSVEELLSRLWSKVLRVAQVGIHDNFFELGGDSILSIQVISMARREGLRLTAAMLFANQTIAELARAVGAVEETEPRAVSPQVASGPVVLTPIQQWFFEQNLSEPSYFNQAYLLQVLSPLDRTLLEGAARAVGLHHDALRLRFTRGERGWEQSYASVPETQSVDWMSLVGLGDEEQTAAIEAAAKLAQSGLDIGTGPLWRIVYFDLGSARPARLLFVVHHLAVDGISWGPLLEDLEAAYQQLSVGKVVQLPERTSSFQSWAHKLQAFAQTERFQQEELPYWNSVGQAAVADPVPTRFGTPKPGQNTEASAATICRTLSPSETKDLLQQVPAVYNTQINDVLLTALTRAWAEWSGSQILFTDLEGHGREALFEDVDVTRTVGWFTSMFPVRLELPETVATWRPGEALVSIKEQLRRIPRRGIGYGLLRYMADTTLAALPAPRIVFNYFGQVDQLLAGSTMFRFANESEGPWHSLTQTRRHVLELNCLVKQGQFEVRCTYSSDLQNEASMVDFTAGIVRALQEIIAHCQSPHAGRRTPSDFPLARLDQVSIDRLMQGRECEDLYPLTPIQTLFLSSDRGGTSASFDQWHCTLQGDLDVQRLREAWQLTLQRHPILRSTIHSEGLKEPIQLVHRSVKPAWTIEDWRGTSSTAHAQGWKQFLEQDLARPLTLTEAPLMRFALCRLSERTWKFVWSIPALLLDGWSWPLVFSEVSQRYHDLEQKCESQLAPVHPYRDYVEWLQRTSSAQAADFWRNNMAGFREPTALPTDRIDWDGSGERYGKRVAAVSERETAQLQETARNLRVTLNTLVQAAWAILLSRQSGMEDVVFGAAFSGRPPDLPGAETIAGPFVNNLPVRVSVNASSRLDDLLKAIHARAWELSQYQFTPLVEIQAATEVPWRRRLFDSLVVFQNYFVDESSRRFGERIEIQDFDGPVHTNFPILLLADPGKELRLSLIFDREKLAPETVERWQQDLFLILKQIASGSGQCVAELLAALSPPAAVRKAPLRKDAAHFVPPQNDMERAIAEIWQVMFETDRISVEENFFDLGGHSMLLVQIHGKIREKLKMDIPIVTLLAHPSVRTLARALTGGTDASTMAANRWKDRVTQQRQALARPRPVVTKRLGQ